MSSVPDPEEAERALSSLFDATANAPSELARARLGAAAAKVAAGRNAERLRLRRLVWPLSLSAAAAVAYLVVAPTPKAPRDLQVTPSSTSETVAPSSTAAVASSQVAAPDVAPPEPEDPVVAVLGGPGDPFDLGPLMQDPESPSPRGRTAAENAGDEVTRPSRSALENRER